LGRWLSVIAPLSSVSTDFKEYALSNFQGYNLEELTDGMGAQENGRYQEKKTEILVYNPGSSHFDDLHPWNDLHNPAGVGQLAEFI
jgi:hypothetical protein